MKIISNSSVLIALEKIKLLHILNKLFGNIYIPKAVADEVFEPEHIPNWIKIKKLKHGLVNQVLEISLGPGESEAISLCKEIKGNLLILDDLKARQIAERMEIRIAGTIGILILAKEKKMIREIRPLLNTLIKTGFRISNEFYTDILDLCNEK